MSTYFNGHLKTNIKRSISIFSLDDLDTFFYKTDNHLQESTLNASYLYVSTIACNKKLLSKLVFTAIDHNYWISQRALSILANGIDIEELTLFIDLLSTHEWYLLIMNPNTKSFAYSHLEHAYGWPRMLLAMYPPCGSNTIIDYVETYSSDRDAMMAVIHLHLNEILSVVYDIDICIWEFLLQLPQGSIIMVRHLGHYDLADQKKIIKMASAN